MFIVVGSEVGALWPGPPGAVELGLLGGSCSPTSQVYNHKWKLGVHWRTGHNACLSAPVTHLGGASSLRSQKELDRLLTAPFDSCMALSRL